MNEILYKLSKSKFRSSFKLKEKDKKYIEEKTLSKIREHAYDFINNGVENIYRETLGTAVNMAVDILKATGMRAYAARRLGQRFMVIDKAMTRKLAKEELSDKVTFTMTEYLDREADLLSEDRHSFDESQWNEYEEYQN